LGRRAGDDDDAVGARDGDLARGLEPGVARVGGADDQLVAVAERARGGLEVLAEARFLAGDGDQDGRAEPRPGRARRAAELAGTSDRARRGEHAVDGGRRGEPAQDPAEDEDEPHFAPSSPRGRENSTGNPGFGIKIQRSAGAGCGVRGAGWIYTFA